MSVTIKYVEFLDNSADMMFELETKYLALNENLDEVSERMNLYESSLKLMVNEAVDDKGKKRFTNAEQRQAELNSIMYNDEKYLKMLEEHNKIKNHY